MPTENEQGEQISFFDQDLWFSKMSKACFPQTGGQTSDVSSKKPQELSIVTPLFLDLRTDSPGAMLGAFWETGFLSLGAYTTRSFGESPNVAVESRLSQILEDRPHPKYCLSAKACQGILNRATKRGKTLPSILEEALRQSVSKSEPDVTGGAKASSFSTNGQERSQPSIIKPSSTVCLEGNGQRPSHKGDGFMESDKSYTLNTTEVHGAAFSQDAYDKYTEADASATIKQSGGVYGGAASHW